MIFRPDRGRPGWGWRMAMITDGETQTMLFSEGLVGRLNSANWGGVMGDIIYGNMGGSLFSAFLTPNSTVDSNGNPTPDKPFGSCPLDVGDGSYTAALRVAGSRHAGQSRRPRGLRGGPQQASCRSRGFDGRWFHAFLQQFRQLGRLAKHGNPCRP